MPQLDFALIADYVRAENGIAHMVAGGIDTIYAQAVPAGQQLGLLARIRLTRAECGRQHEVEVLFQGPDGDRLAEVSGAFGAEWTDDDVPGGAVGVLLSFNLGVPLPDYGPYSFEILVNGSSLKSIPVRVMELPEPSE